MSNRAIDIYTDGGCILRNPSPHGITWAWQFVSDGEVLRSASGVYTVADAGLPFQVLGNNTGELIAAVRALESAPDDWRGLLHTDSQNTLRRLTQAIFKTGGVPQTIVERLMVQRNRFRIIRVVLLDGHPTKEQLRLGLGKRGAPVSIFNVNCDEMCQKEAHNYLLQKGQSDVSP
jgi:ribonuclease HI